MCTVFHRFEKRIFISSKSTRQLLLNDFVRKDIGELGFAELIDICNETVPCLVEFIKYLTSHQESFTKFSCPEILSDFVLALASPSPVCALV